MTQLAPEDRPLSVYIDHALEDSAFVDALVGHLRGLRGFGDDWTSWAVKDVRAGEEWEQRIHEELERARVIVLLVSRFSRGSEATAERWDRASARHEEEGIAVLPVLVRPCDLGEDPVLAGRRLVPTDGLGKPKPVNAFDDEDEAWTQVSRDVRGFVEEALGTGPSRAVVLATYRETAAGELDTDLLAARARGEIGAYHDAEQILRGALESVDAQREQDPDDRRTLRRRGPLRLELASVVAARQDRDGARRLLELVEREDELEDDERARLGRLWVALGELERARETVSHLGDVAARVRDGVRAARGEPLPETQDEWLLSLQLLHEAAEYGWDRAATVARRLLALPDLSVGGRVQCIQALSAYLGASIQSWPELDEPVRPEDRTELVEELRALLRSLDSGTVAPELASAVARVGAVLAFQTDVPEAFRPLTEHLDDLVYRGQPEMEFDAPFAAAVRAIASLERRGDRDAAATSALDAALAHPNVANLQSWAARLLQDVGRADEALAPARRWLELVPTRGPTWLLATIHAALNDHAAAWRLARGLNLTDVPSLDRLRALMAVRAEAYAEADGALSAALARHDDDVEVLLALAETKLSLGQAAEASELAWRAYEADEGDALGPPHLVYIAQTQAAGGQLDGNRRTRVREIARVLRDRFRHDPVAEQGRLHLMVLAGLDDASELPDFDFLEGRGLVWRGEGIDEVARIVRQQQEKSALVHRLYEAGCLGMDTIVRWTRASPYELIIGALATAAPSAKLLTPASFTPGPGVAGAALLCGVLELAVLSELELVEAVDEALGPDGRWVLFEDVVERIDGAWRSLSPGLQLGRLADLRAAKDLLTQRADWRGGDPSGPDSAWAAAEGLPILTHERDVAAATVHPGAVARLGRFDDGERNTWLARFAEWSEERVPAQLARRVVVDWVVLSYLDQEQLRRVLDGASREQVRLVVGPWAASLIRGDIARIEAERDVYALARATGRHLTDLKERARVQVMPRPTPPKPATIAFGDRSEDMAELLADVWSWYEPLVGGDADQTVLLTADYAVGAWFTGTEPPALVEALALAPEAARAALERYRGTGERRLHLPDLVRSLGLSPAIQSQKLERLLDVGFHEALDEHVFREIAVRARGQLAGGEAKRLLSAAERMLMAADHPGQSAAAHRVLRAMADGVWASCEDARLDEPARERLVHATLDRVLALQEATPGPIMRFAMWLGFAAVLDAATSVESDSTTEHIHVGGDSPAGRFWALVADWCRVHPHVRPEVHIGLVKMMEGAEHFGVDLSRALQQVAVALASRALTPADGLFHPDNVLMFARLTRWGRSTLGIQSEGVELNPSSQHAAFPLDHLMRTAAASLAASEGPVGAFVNASATSGMMAVHYSVPTDALLDWLDDAAFASVVPRYLAVVDASDGRAASALRAWLAAPDDEDTRDACLRALTYSPARIVRAHPPAFAELAGAYLSVSWPRSLDDLRELLREPEPPDADARLTHAASVPLHPLGASHHTLVVDAPVDVRDAWASQLLAVLFHPDDWPSGEIARAVVILGAEASRRRFVPHEGAQVDLRVRLPELVSELVRASTADPPEGTVAAAEGPAYRLAYDIVRMFELAGDAQLEAAERLWLTMRLGEWSLTRLGESSAPARLRGVAWLRASDAARLARMKSFPVDLHHPYGWVRSAEPGRRLDLRLASVLGAMTLGRFLVEALRAERHGAQVQGALPLQPALRDLLVQLAQRPETPYEQQLLEGVSAFEWPGGTTIPELAMAALLTLSDDGWAALPDATRARWALRAVEDTGTSALLDLVAGHVLSEAGSTSDTERTALGQLPDEGEGLRHVHLTLAAVAVQARPAQPSLDCVTAYLASADPERSGHHGLAGRLLYLCARETPDALVATASALLDGWSRPMLVVSAFRRALDDPAAAAAARAALEDLAADPRVANDDDAGRTLEDFGIVATR